MRSRFTYTLSLLLFVLLLLFTSTPRSQGQTSGTPVVQNDFTASGVINTQNLNSTVAATQFSAVASNPMNNAGDCTIQVVGTYTGALTVQISLDGTNWVNVTSILNINLGTYSTTITSGTTGIFQVGVEGARFVQVTALGAVTGSATVSIRVSSTDSTVSIDTPIPIPASGIIGGVTLPDTVMTGQGSQTALNNNVVLATAGSGGQSVAGYRSWSIEIVVSAGTFTAGAITFEASNDGTNWSIIDVYDQAAPTANPISTYTLVAATNRFFKGPLNFSNIRARISTGITGTNTGIQAFTVFSTGTFFPEIITQNLANLGGSAISSAGVAGALGVGGITAGGSANGVRPVGVSGIDVNNIVRNNLTSVLGETQVYGDGESVTNFTIGTGAAAVTDGTNGKTINLLPGKEGDVYLYISAVSTTPTIQVEISYDNVLFAIIPFTRIDNTAVSQQFASVASFTPVAGAVYRGRTYGADILRLHLTAGTATNTIGAVRVQYQPEIPGVLVSPFAFQSTGTTEAVGVANGQVYTGSVRTLTVPAKGSSVVTVDFEANTGGSNVVSLEGSQDYGATWNALPMQPITGGATVTTFTNTGTAALPGSAIFQCDVSNQTQIRAHCTTYASGAIYGFLKLVNVPTDNRASSRHPTYTASVSGNVTATTNVLAIISGSAKTVTIKRVTVNGGDATAVALGTLTLIRGSVAAPAAGTVITAATMQHNPADAAFSGSVLQGIASAITTVGLTSVSTSTVLLAPTDTTVLGLPPTFTYDLTNDGQCEGYQIPVAATNSMLFSFNGQTGGTNFAMTVDFTEE